MKKFKTEYCNLVPVFNETLLTDDKKGYISYCRRSNTTALVETNSEGHQLGFYILHGDHREEYLKLSHSFDSCSSYFNLNVNLATDTSDFFGQPTALQKILMNFEKNQK